MDIATANGGSNDVSILLGDGHGALAAQQRVPVATEPRTILAARVDGNDSVDLILAAPGAAGIPILFGRGNGMFDRAVIGGGFRPWWAALGDVTGDDIADLVTANAETSDLTMVPSSSACRRVPTSFTNPKGSSRTGTAST